MANVNVGTRSKAGDAEALEAKIKAEKSEGKKVVEKDGKTFLTEKTVGGLTISTRIA
ncbi:hypothetical protein [Parasphingorhabdus sp.]|uniref:hypothetical protein n=1 Tax=Parasphingorhabdus sp. TaxID=2709688 RepID=UPI003A94BD0F